MIYALKMAYPYFMPLDEGKDDDLTLLNKPAALTKPNEKPPQNEKPLQDEKPAQDEKPPIDDAEKV